MNPFEKTSSLQETYKISVELKVRHDNSFLKDSILLAFVPIDEKSYILTVAHVSARLQIYHVQQEHDIFLQKVLKVSKDASVNNFSHIFLGDNKQHLFMCLKSNETLHFDILSKQKYFQPIDLLSGNEIISCISNKTSGCFILGSKKGKVFLLFIRPESQFYFDVKLLMSFEPTNAVEHILDIDTTLSSTILILCKSGYYLRNIKIDSLNLSEKQKLTLTEFPFSTSRNDGIIFAVSKVSSDCTFLIAFGKTLYSCVINSSSSLLEATAIFDVSQVLGIRNENIRINQTLYHYIIMVPSKVLVINKVDLKISSATKTQSKKRISLNSNSIGKNEKSLLSVFNTKKISKQSAMPQEKNVPFTEEKFIRTFDGDPLIILSNFNVYNLILSNEKVGIYLVYWHQGVKENNVNLLDKALTLVPSNNEITIASIYSDKGNILLKRNLTARAVEAFVKSNVSFKLVGKVIKSQSLKQYILLVCSLINQEAKAILDYPCREKLYLECFKSVLDLENNNLDKIENVKLLLSQVRVTLNKPAINVLLNVAHNDNEIFITMCEHFHAMGRLLKHYCEAGDQLNAMKLLEREKCLSSEIIEVIYNEVAIKIQNNIDFVLMLKYVNVIRVEKCIEAMLFCVEIKTEKAVTYVVEVLEHLIFALFSTDFNLHNLYFSTLCNSWNIKLSDHVNILFRKKCADFILNYSNFKVDDDKLSLTQTLDQKELHLCLLSHASEHVKISKFLHTIGEEKEKLSLLEYVVMLPINRSNKRHILESFLVEYDPMTVLPYPIIVLLLNIGKNILSVERVLNHFPTISKDEIKTLVNTRLREQRDIISENRTNMNIIEDKQEELMNRQSAELSVDNSVKCSFCDKDFASGTKQFIYPCKHAFHFSCVTLCTRNLISVEDAAHIDVFLTTINDNSTDASSLKSNAEKMLEDFLSQSCCYCGDIVVKSLDTSLFNDHDGVEASIWDI